MNNRFVRRLESWLPQTLREKAMLSTHDGRLCFIGADDLATCVADFVITEVGLAPGSGWTECGIEEVGDDMLCGLTALSPETVAAGLIGASVELSVWEGEEAISFLCAHGVPEDAARDVSDAVGQAVERLCARGQALINELDRIPFGTPETVFSVAM